MLGGGNTNGQLGIGSTTFKKSPTRVGTDSDWQRIVGIGGYSNFIQKNNILYAWGYNNNGQLGLGDTVQRNNPTEMNIDFEFDMIASGMYHTCGIRKDNGKLYCWGYNGEGQLGMGDTVQRNSPTLVTGTME